MNLSIGLSLTRPSGPLGAPAFSPASLFASGEEGAWYDPSDLTTLYQDAAGTTPVTGTGQPVGLMLDKSKGLTLGSELVDTANDAAEWVPFGTNTVVQDGDAVKITFVSDNKGARVLLTQAAGLTQDLLTTSFYRLTFEAKINTGAANVATVSIGPNQTFALSTSYQTFTVQGPKGSGSNPYIQFSGLSAGEIAYIKNISVKELPGNHATQSTSTARPTLQTSGGLYYLDFDGVDDFLVAQYGTTLSNITRGVAYRADADNDFVFDDYDDVNVCSLYVVPATSNLRFAVNGAGAGNIVTGVGGWVLGDDEVAVATALSTSALALQGSGNPASGTSSSAPANINGVTLGAAATGLLELNGRIYGFVDVSRGLDAAEIASLESYLAAKSGVTL